jgi:putative inorganic carbon (HCO3(-)) transporter
VNTWTERLLALIILGTALAFGGVVPLAYSSMEIAVFILLFVVLALECFRGQVTLRWPWPVCILIAWVLLEIIPLPRAVIRLLSPVREHLMASVNPQWVSGSLWTLSIDPHRTLLYLMRLLAYAGAFALAAWAFNPRKGKSPLVNGLILLGTFEALYGLYQYLTNHQKIFGYTKVAYATDATGTYINRNHFAGLLELIVPLVIAVGFYQFQVWQRERWQIQHSSSEANVAAYRGFFYIFLAILMGLAAICSHSRMGIFGLLTSLIFIFLLGQARSGLGIWKAVSLLVVFGILAYGSWLGLGPALRRFENIGKPGYLENEGRLQIWEDSKDLIHDYPVTGTGLGTFGEAFRHYQRHLTYAFVSHAHGDYIEFTCDIGLLGALLLFGSIFWLWLKSIRAFWGEMSPYRHAIILGCIGSTMAILIHSTTDFNLQIPANALILATILGINYKAVCLRKQERAAPAEAAPPEGLSHGAIRLS